MITGPSDAWIERNPDDPGDPYFEGGEPQEEPLFETEEEQPTDSTADDWQPIAEQIQFWADMDAQYWTTRREQAYRAYLERKLHERKTTI